MVTTSLPRLQCVCEWSTPASFVQLQWTRYGI